MRAKGEMSGLLASGLDWMLLMRPPSFMIASTLFSWYSLTLSFTYRS